MAERTWLERVIPLPDVRVLIACAYFSLAFRILYMVEGHTALLDSAPFLALATMILGTGGLGMVAMFWFGGTKAGTEVMKTQNEKLTGPGSPQVDKPA